MKNDKRIHNVTIKRMFDESPDTSWLGEYTDNPQGEFAIDAQHDIDCPKFWANRDVPEDFECSCADRTERNTFQYFNPGSVEDFNNGASWIPKKLKSENVRRAYWMQTMKSNARKDFARMEALNDGYYAFIGIRAEAQVLFGTSNGDYLLITSGGLWGIESDSNASYLAEVEQEQLSELRQQLHAIGFSNRAISAAFKNVERGEL